MWSTRAWSFVFSCDTKGGIGPASEDDDNLCGTWNTRVYLKMLNESKQGDENEKLTLKLCTGTT